MIFQEILSGDVNRAQSASVGIGGKGQDVLLATSCMELVDKKKTGLLQFIGSGCEGDTLLSMLENLLPGCLHPSPQLLTVRTKGRCRTCITLIEEKSKHHSTELIEPSPAILHEEETVLLDLVSTSYATRKVGAIAFMGSLPPNVSKDIYASIITRSCDSSSKVILDTVVGLSEAITACHLIGSTAIVKINAFELLKLVGYETSTAIDNSSLIEAISQLISQAAPDLIQNSKLYFAITDGPRPTRLVHPLSSRIWSFVIDRDNIHVTNPIGAGDTVAAGLLQFWTENVNIDSAVSDRVHQRLASSFRDEESFLIGKALAWGIACGTASCTTVENSVFDSALASDYFDSIKCS
eukprot:gene1839-2013_t